MAGKRTGANLKKEVILKLSPYGINLISLVSVGRWAKYNEIPECYFPQNVFPNIKGFRGVFFPRDGYRDISILDLIRQMIIKKNPVKVHWIFLSILIWTIIYNEGITLLILPSFSNSSRSIHTSREVPG